jgi:hypothetical protein
MNHLLSVKYNYLSVFTYGLVDGTSLTEQYLLNAVHPVVLVEHSKAVPKQRKVVVFCG